MHVKNTALAVCGFLLLALAAAGIALPVLPTTPFVLAAFACFSGAPKYRRWMLRQPLCAEFILSYREQRGLRSSTLIFSLCFLWGALLLSMFALRSLWLALLLCAVGGGVTIHLLFIALPKDNEAITERKKHEPK